MKLNDLYPFPEERKKRRRIGRGSGSGYGKTAGKGHKGQKARSGGKVAVGFEGGQMPLQRKVPKYGFSNAQFKVDYAVINVSDLAELFEGKTEISLEDFYERGVAKKGTPVKVLGNGEISVAVKVEAHKFSATAIEKIVKAGGEAKALEG